MSRLEAVARWELRVAFYRGDALACAYGVPIDFRSACSRVSELLLLAEFACCSADESSVVTSFHFWRFFVGISFLVAALAKEPEDYSSEDEGERDTDCAADDDAELRAGSAA